MSPAWNAAEWREWHYAQWSKAGKPRCRLAGWAGSAAARNLCVWMVEAAKRTGGSWCPSCGPGPSKLNPFDPAGCLIGRLSAAARVPAGLRGPSHADGSGGMARGPVKAAGEAGRVRQARVETALDSMGGRGDNDDQGPPTEGEA